MKLSFKDYDLYRGEYHGYCTKCDDMTNDSDVEPDAIGYECIECGCETVMGIENALLEGLITITTNEEEK